MAKKSIDREVEAQEAEAPAPDVPAGGSAGNTGNHPITHDDLKPAAADADQKNPDPVEAEKSTPVDIPANKPYPEGNPPGPVEDV